MLANLQTRNFKPSPKVKAQAELELRRRAKARLIADKLPIWRAQPEVYAKERLNLDLTDSQVQILRSVMRNRRTAVKAHHALGKTFIAAVALLWWLDCWDSHIGYITAPTWGQALGLTFKQAKRLAMINKLDFDILRSGIIRDRDEFKATERFVKALNAETGEGFQGEHTSPILIVVEEAVGVPKYIFEAAGGLMTDPRCRQLEIANPTDEATEFGTNCESPNYEVFAFSALDHPNILAELKCAPQPFPGAVSLLWLFEELRDEADVVTSKAEDCFEFYALDAIEAALNGMPVSAASRKVWYKPTAYFQGRVLGQFPTEASSKVIPSGWLASLTPHEIDLSHHIQLGCDIARFGDDRTTIFARIGAVALLAKEIRKFDGLAVTAAIKDCLREVCRMLGLPDGREKFIQVNIDVTGGMGTGPFDLLLSEGYNAVGINSSEKAKESELYRNKRSELWFDVRDRVKEKNIDISRLDLEVKRKLIKELSIPEYKIQGGKKVVEEKSETKKRLGASPDLADGFNLSFYEAIIFEQEEEYSFSVNTY